MIPSFDHWQAMPAQWQGGAVALGNFDGVHRGHQALLDRTAEHAKVLNAPVVALTFEPHPRRFFVPDTGPFRLTLPPARLRLLEQYGVQAVLAQRFDEAFAALSADAFIDDVLLKGLGARHVVCGYDFTFGARRGGNVEMLREKGRQKGFGVTVLDPVMRERSEVTVREGQMYLLPSHVRHCPQRPEGCIGLVIERYRQPGEVDALEWYDAAGSLEFRGEFVVGNIEENLVEVQTAWKNWSQTPDRRIPTIWRAPIQAIAPG